MQWAPVYRNLLIPTKRASRRFCCVQVVDGGRVWAQQAGDPRVAWLTQQLASASLSSSRVRAAACSSAPQRRSACQRP